MQSVKIQLSGQVTHGIAHGVMERAADSEQANVERDAFDIDGNCVMANESAAIAESDKPTKGSDE